MHYRVKIDSPRSLYKLGTLAKPTLLEQLVDTSWCQLEAEVSHAPDLPSNRGPTKWLLKSAISANLRPVTQTCCPILETLMWYFINMNKYWKMTVCHIQLKKKDATFCDICRWFEVLFSITSMQWWAMNVLRGPSKRTDFSLLLSLIDTC